MARIAKLVPRDKAWQIVYYRPDGTRRRLSAGTDRQVAERLLLRVNEWLWEGKDPDNELARNGSEGESPYDYDTRVLSHFHGAILTVSATIHTTAVLNLLQ